MKIRHLSVRVPATTANLGPGFDTFGLALDLWNEAVFDLEGNDFSVDFSGPDDHKDLPSGCDNLIARAFAYLYQCQGASLPSGVHITCTNRIPTGSGMGSSAAAILTGLGAANTYLGHPLDEDGLLVLASKMEGHPDNAAAGIFGGLTVSLSETGHVMTQRFDVPSLPAAIAVPKFHLPTQTAREALPECITMKDAVFNIGRAVLVVDALRRGDLDLLGQVMVDRLHQPYRFKLIPGCLLALDAAKTAGAKAAALSGAGPGILAFAEPDVISAVAEAMRAQFVAAGLDCQSMVLNTSQKGMQVDY